MNYARTSFLVLIASLLVIVKCLFIQNIQGPICFPDELTYGSDLPDRIIDLFNLSLYSPFPFFFGYYGGLIFNCAITSLAAIPIFFLFRKFQNEKAAAILTVLFSLWGPFWAYSFLNMTEALMFFVVLNALLFRTQWIMDFVAIAVKPLGAALFFGRHQQYLLAILAGLVYSVFFIYGGMGFNISGYLLNGVHSLARSIGYVLIGSLGLIALPLFRYRNKATDADDTFVLRYLFATFCLLLPAMMAVPSSHFFGRYLDSAIMLIFPIAMRGPISRQDILRIGTAILIGGALLFNTPGDLVLDSALQPFTTTLQNILSLQGKPLPS